jgi:hypothetical protein
VCSCFCFCGALQLSAPSERESASSDDSARMRERRAQEREHKRAEDAMRRQVASLTDHDDDEEKEVREQEQKTTRQKAQKRADRADAPSSAPRSHEPASLSHAKGRQSSATLPSARSSTSKPHDAQVQRTSQPPMSTPERLRDFMDVSSPPEALNVTHRRPRALVQSQ